MKHQKFFDWSRVWMMLAICTAVLVLLPWGGSAAPTPQAAGGDQSAAKPKLAGTWKLNKDQSDDPHKKMQQAMGGSGGQGEGHGWGGRGRGQEGGGEGNGHGRGAGMMDDLSQLTIEQTDSKVKVTGASGRVLALYPSSEQGSSTPSSGGRGDEAGATSTAQWQGNQLVVVTQGMHRGKMTRTYALSPDGSQLYVTTQMESKRFSQPVTFRLVYDPVKASGGGTQ
jgi:hypothetical protein